MRVCVDTWETLSSSGPLQHQTQVLLIPSSILVSHSAVNRLPFGEESVSVLVTYLDRSCGSDMCDFGEQVLNDTAASFLHCLGS